MGTPVSRDYAQSALRHFRDAELLAAGGRFDDAGHLIGLAAECALKHGAQGFTTPKGAEINGHLPTIKTHVRQILQGRNIRGPLLAFVSSHEHFAGWHVNDRYRADGHIDQPQYAIWRTETQKAFRIVNLRIVTG